MCVLYMNTYVSRMTRVLRERLHCVLHSVSKQCIYALLQMSYYLLVSTWNNISVLYLHRLVQHTPMLSVRDSEGVTFLEHTQASSESLGVLEIQTKLTSELIEQYTS